MSDDDDKRIVDSVLALVGISDHLSADGRLSGETRDRLLRTEWDAAADVLEADPILGPVLNKRIGTSFWDQQLVLEAEVLYDLVIGSAQAADPGIGVGQALAPALTRFSTSVVSEIRPRPPTSSPQSERSMQHRPGPDRPPRRRLSPAKSAGSPASGDAKRTSSVGSAPARSRATSAGLVASPHRRRWSPRAKRSPA